MIRKCYYCGEIMGEKEPIDDKSITSGECNLCYSLFQEWYRLWQFNRITEQASHYIRRVRLILKNPKEGDVQC